MSPLLDYDYIFAQEVLADDEYALFYATRAGRIPSLMDNGIHETGAPLSVLELKEACKRVKPTFLIPPDWFGKAKETYDGFRTAVDVITDSTIFFAPVLQGETREERMQLVSNVYKHPRVGRLCLPFRYARYEWMLEIESYFNSAMPRIHLLGMKSWEELRTWRRWLVNRGIQTSNISFDTTKPIKFGVANIRFDSLNDEIRGKGGFPKEKVTKVSPMQRLDVLYNIAALRTALL